MIVREDWNDEGGRWWSAEKPHKNLSGESLQYYRDVPTWLWKLYVTAQSLVDLLDGRMEECPELPEYVAYRVDRDARQARVDRERRVAEEGYRRDLAIQEEIRRAGALAPLLKDCPTDEPVRIKGG